MRTKHASTPERSFSDWRRTGLTIILGHLIPPPSRQPWSKEERFRPSGYTATSAYWAQNTSMRPVRSILARGGPTHRSLTDTGGGYNLGGVDLPHTTLRPSQPTVSTFHLRPLLGLRLFIQSFSKDLKRKQTLNLVRGSLHSTSTVSYHLGIVSANGNHQMIG
jgi:hypothetical protein